MSQAKRGRFVWHELLTTDPDAAQRFYSDVVGWTTGKWQGKVTPDMPPYTMWMVGEQSIGGVMELPEDARLAGAPSHWLAYVSTPDTDALAKRVSGAGGTILVPPMDIPEVGRMFVFADPQGATLAGYTPAGEIPGSDGAPGVGAFSWHELATTDYEAAFAFYHDLFGWEKTEQMDMGPAGIYQMYGLDGTHFGGIYNKPDDMPAPPNWLHYARVPDVHKAAERAKKLGGQILNGPMEVPGGDWIVQAMDPQGAMFALHHVAQG
jgi:hypothetical protein